ncbi:MAG: transcriptional regulator PpsR [Burkholderiaceae bacterium]|nr:transcriptional regulator PpsR [Burkholderiaceae bacterium]
MTRRAPEPADLGTLSGCAAEMAEAFVSLASDIALVIDDNGVIQSVAQSATTPISTNSSQWVGRPWADMVSGDTRRKVELMLTDLRTTGVARRREVNITGENDSDVPVAFSALRLGTLGPLLAVGRDLRAVSAIQQRFLDAQQELERGYWRSRQAESRYRLLFQVATDAVLTVDAHSLRVVEANHAAASMLGAGIALAGRVAPELFDRSSRGALQNLLLNARADGKTAEINVRLPKSQALAAVSATPFRAGGGMRLLLRVRSAAAPASHGAEMNKTLALLVDSTRDGIVVTDSSGRILVANPAFLALVQTASEEEVRGRAIGEWLGRIEADVAALLAGAHAHGIAHLVRSSLRRHDGVSLDVDVTGAMLAEGEQECFGFTVRPCEARGDANAAWLKSLMLLEERVGVSTLPELMSQAQQMIEQRFVRLAMARAHGDVPAAAGVLGIAVEKLLRALALEDAAPAQPPTP